MLPAVTLTDRFERRQGPILISGVQALVRLMLLQADRDRAAGLVTGGFVSGYRGSPLGTLDQAFASARKYTAERGIEVMPGVNEELAATAIAGTQQIDTTPDAKVAGVFSLWYGKGPGLDRAADAIRHGNIQGASQFGGVVLAVGDDHVAKSSTIACYSDETVASLHVPLFYPADPREVVEYGLHGFAMSRHTGSWAAVKIVTDVADSARTVAADELAFAPSLPPIAGAPRGVHFRWPETPLEQEAKQIEVRLPAVADYVLANGLDKAFNRTDASRIGIIAAGKTWNDLRSALDMLGLDDAALQERGIALYKPAMIWPLEQRGLSAFAEGLERLLVLEDKGGFIEGQVKSILYGKSGFPAVAGKKDFEGSPLLPAVAELTPEKITVAIGRIARLGPEERELPEQLRALLETANAAQGSAVLRKPFFCSGCPHNRSTVLPDGSRAYSGIGCHGMSTSLRPRHSGFCQMGGEGVHWVGLSRFTNEDHVFANLGDGTYFHSGILAIRQAVASGANLTYKILYNSAVAMTGGQPVDGELSVEQMAEQLRAEGVRKIVLVTDDPDRYAGHALLKAAGPRGPMIERVEHRDDIDAVQRDLRTEKGVTVLLYDQMCATEKRRLRKRGKMAEPSRRVFINTAVCEGCGDCSVKSNCLSVEPEHTPLGVKRKINQSTCNKDYSCLTGFCPSFVTIEGASPRKAANSQALAGMAPLPEIRTVAPEENRNILVTGIGGTGVVTIGALIAMAAHIEGRKAGVLDQVGLAQKGGAVTSHIHVGPDDIHALRTRAAGADLLIACDEVGGNSRDAIAAIDPGRTRVVANSDMAITGDFTGNRDMVIDAAPFERNLSEKAGVGNFAAFPFTRLAERLLGNAIGANLMMVGYAWQSGWLYLDADALDAAIELNGVALAMNRSAIEIGRGLAQNPDAVMQAAGLADPAAEQLDDVISRLAADLERYQDSAYSERFLSIVATARDGASALGGGDGFVDAVARSLYKLMAYKDEYEVARLYTDGRFADALREQFEGGGKPSFYLAPPFLARRDPVTGQARKRKFGPWVFTAFRILARMKHLRGGPLDVFGKTHERRMERALIERFEAIVAELAGALCPANLDLARQIAAMPMEIRGYGHVKEAAVTAFDAELPSRMSAFRDAAQRGAANATAVPEFA
ncbi:indolepyruvate ferredoxin oxidoreductase family protein [Croceicoccus marinus]|uniref:Indolepyruvate ferredoxin oxidoreductase n=1 Tax=Croceicoccus marinus TaxID=450378 RepID=A0A1Z1FE98_9SPHN|nr:indolepyruvate ferredoxin oxidoreductase family protein [Croceicoccus marinus]ARU17141.1 hypothetical protein A9D14_00995 [Croceicoccus marinus]